MKSDDTAEETPRASLKGAPSRTWPSLQAWTTQISLYSPQLATTIRELRETLVFPDKIDAFCVHCGRGSIFDAAEEKQPFLPRELGPEEHEDAFFPPPEVMFERELRCARNEDHRLTVWFRLRGPKLIKIGQWPSLADLAEPTYRKYRSVLGAGIYRDLIRGIGLSAHGVGAGSLVYLRRVFEHLVDEAHDAAIADKEWDEVNYQKAKVRDRVKLLAAHLPDFMVENRAIWGVMSRGIHNLPEQKCLEIFPRLKLAIELTLDAKVAEREKAKKIREVRDLISDDSRGKTGKHE